MTTSTSSLIEDYLDNITGNGDAPAYTIEPDKSRSFVVFLSKWFLRLACMFIFVVCPWANYKLIALFQTRAFYKESSAKWYIIFKAIFDTVFMFISIPVIFCLTFNIDIVHKNYFTCKSITYIHYLSDDLISMMLTLLCIDRMIRITCGYHLRKRFSLTLCIITTLFFLILNIHHIIRLKHSDGYCQKIYYGIWDYDFDIYYSIIYTSITWTIIFIASINLCVSVYCDRARHVRIRKAQNQQEHISKISMNGRDSDRVELIHSTDDWEDPTVLTIEQNNLENKSFEQEQQDNIDLQLTVCVLITSAIFLGFNVIGYIFIYIALFPLLIAHTISYFVFNHLAARIFSNNSS